MTPSARHAGTPRPYRPAQGGRANSKRLSRALAATPGCGADSNLPGAHNMSETQLSPTTSSDHFSRAAASLKAAERDAQAAIDSAVDGLSTAYGQAKPLLSRVNQRAREMAHDGYDAARERAA